MDILYRDAATEAGIAHYRRVPTMNCRVDFIEAMARIVEGALPCDADRTSRPACIYSLEASIGDDLSCACDRGKI
jgi:hypothetical protein